MALKICPTCGKKYHIDTTSCDYCQTTLITKPESGEKQCPHCQKCLPSLLLYCPYCNHLTEPAPVGGTGIPNNKATASIFFLILRDIFLLILYWIAFNSNNVKNVKTLNITINIIATAYVVFAVLGFIFSILGLKKSKETGTGKVLSIICIIISGFVIASLLVFLFL